MVAFPTVAAATAAKNALDGLVAHTDGSRVRVRYALESEATQNIVRLATEWRAQAVAERHFAQRSAKRLAAGIELPPRSPTRALWLERFRGDFAELRSLLEPFSPCACLPFCFPLLVCLCSCLCHLDREH
jgi:hypothetical protein